MIPMHGFGTIERERILADDDLFVVELARHDIAGDA